MHWSVNMLTSCMHACNEAWGKKVHLVVNTTRPFHIIYSKDLCRQIDIVPNIWKIESLWGKYVHLFPHSYLSSFLLKVTKVEINAAELSLIPGKILSPFSVHSTFTVCLQFFYVLYLYFSYNTNGYSRAQRLINLEIPVLIRSLKLSNVELG